MTVTMFLTLFTIGSAVCSLLTQAIKVAFKEWAVTYSSNTIALINAFIVGICGTICSYMILGVPFSGSSVACIVLMAVSIWIGSMVGYDKVMQLYKQIMSVKLQDLEDK